MLSSTGGCSKATVSCIPRCARRAGGCTICPLAFVARRRLNLAARLARLALAGRCWHRSGGRAMFTGIVEELGTVRAITPVATGAHLTIGATTVLQGVQIGDSISTNGCCLTVVGLDEGSYKVDVIEETLKMTCLGSLQVGDRVNLERSV